MMIMKMEPILCIQHWDLAKTQGGANFLNTFDPVSHHVLKNHFWSFWQDGYFLHLASLLCHWISWSWVLLHKKSTALSYLTENILRGNQSYYQLDKLRAVVKAEVREKNFPLQRFSPECSIYRRYTLCTPCLCGRFRIGVHTCITHWFSVFNNVALVSIFYSISSFYSAS